jgi:CMP-N,N'-diacetyllegionaminic acid synthase
MKLKGYLKMFSDKTFLAIIPARGGSKRLLHKNLLLLGGKPLVTRTIESALKSSFIDEVLVTSDNEQTIEIAKNLGASAPFIRPAVFSSDMATSSDVISHAIEYYETECNKTFDYIIYLNPTTPLRDERHIDEAIELLFLNKVDAVISVCELEHPISWTGILPKTSDMTDFIKNIDFNSRSQDLPKSYRLNGAIYICKTDKFKEFNSLFLKENIYAYKMTRETSVDIDTKIDFLLAEAILANNEIPKA